MKTPHDLFVKYVYSRKKSPPDFVPEKLPIRTLESFGKMTKRGSKKYKGWLETNNLVNLPKRVQVIYDMWNNQWSRHIMCVLIMRGKESIIPSILSIHGKWLITDEQVELYKHLFFDVSTWSGVNHLCYLEILQPDEYVNYEKAYGPGPYESILFDLGAEIPPETAEDALDRLMAVSFNEFESSADPKEKISWGKLVFMLIKEKKKDKDTTNAQKVLEQLRIELPDIANVIHELGEDEEIV